MSSKERRERLENFYRQAASNFLEWSPDPKRSGLYSLHIGYQNWKEPVSNSDSVLQMSQKIIEHSKVKAGQRILDAGCGVGNLSFEINAIEQKAKVYGVDITHDHIQLANQYKRQEQTSFPQFSVQDFEHIGFSSSIFDRVIYCESFIHSDNKESLIQESSRLLRPKGIIIIADIFMHTEELTKAESNILEGLKVHMHTPDLTHIKKLITLLSVNGFSHICPSNITEHVITPVKYYPQLERTSDGIEVPLDMVTLLVGLQELMRNGKAGYYLVTAKKS